MGLPMVGGNCVGEEKSARLAIVLSHPCAKKPRMNGAPRLRLGHLSNRILMEFLLSYGNSAGKLRSVSKQGRWRKESKKLSRLRSIFGLNEDELIDNYLEPVSVRTVSISCSFTQVIRASADMGREYT